MLTDTRCPYYYGRVAGNKRDFSVNFALLARMLPIGKAATSPSVTKTARSHFFPWLGITGGIAIPSAPPEWSCRERVSPTGWRYVATAAGPFLMIGLHGPRCSPTRITPAARAAITERLLAATVAAVRQMSPSQKAQSRFQPDLTTPFTTASAGLGFFLRYDSTVYLVDTQNPTSGKVMRIYDVGTGTRSPFSTTSTETRAIITFSTMSGAITIERLSPAQQSPSIAMTARAWSFSFGIQLRKPSQRSMDHHGRLISMSMPAEKALRLPMPITHPVKFSQ